MSRIQNILEKAEREGAALHTSRLVVPATPAPFSVKPRTMTYDASIVMQASC